VLDQLTGDYKIKNRGQSTPVKTLNVCADDIIKTNFLQKCDPFFRNVHAN